MTFADYIQQFKDDMGLSNQDLAKLLGVGPVTLKNIVSGYAYPSRQAMERLLNTLAYKPDDGPESQVIPNEKLPFSAVKPNWPQLAVPVEEDNLSSLGLEAGALATLSQNRLPKAGDILCVELEGRLCFRQVVQSGEELALDDGQGRMMNLGEAVLTGTKLYGIVTSAVRKFD